MSIVKEVVAADDDLTATRGTDIELLLGKLREKLQMPPVCRRHKFYKGLRRPRRGCEICESIYDFMRHSGVKEKRDGAHVKQL